MVLLLNILDLILFVAAPFYLSDKGNQMIELDRKLQQMHMALSSVVSQNITSIQPKVSISNSHVFVSLDLNENSDPIRLYNSASLLIANIASLKDHLKVWCKRNDVVFEGDHLIKNNNAVALIHDLWNTDKHAELNNPSRSGHKPKLGNVQTALRISTGDTIGSGVRLSLDPKTGRFVSTSTDGGKMNIVLDSQILDESDNPIADFAQTCEEAVDAWLRTLEAAGVIIP